MATFKQQINRVGLRALREQTKNSRIPSRILSRIGEELRDEMIDNLGKGISPIEERGRFPGYKNPDNYPLRVRNLFPNKRSRPVNLRLSGKFWKALKFRIRGDNRIQFRRQGGPSIEIGFFDRTNALKEKGHREGANSQLERPIIPRSSESFTPKLIDAVIRRLVKFLNS